MAVAVLYQNGTSHDISLEAFTKFFTTHRKALLRYAIKHVPGGLDAVEEVLSVLYVKCAPAWKEGRCRPDNGRSYLFRALSNLTVDRYRRRDEADLDQATTLYDDTRTLKEFSGVVDRICLAHALKQIPKNWRDPLILSDLEDYPASEGARILNISCPAYKARLSRGRDALRLQLQEQGFTD